MAAISANGAAELARFEATRQGSGDPYKVTIVLTSDGRLLRKIAGSGYSVLARIRDAKSRTADELVRVATAYASKREYSRVSK